MRYVDGLCDWRIRSAAYAIVKDRWAQVVDDSRGAKGEGI